MLPSENRLKGEANYNRIKEKGELHQEENFAVSTFKREDKEHSRFGVVVSLKISRLAVNRNRVKRAIYEALRQNLNLIPKGYDMVFLVKKRIAKVGTESIMREVADFFKKKSYYKN